MFATDNDAEQAPRVDRPPSSLCFATASSLPATQGQRWEAEDSIPSAALCWAIRKPNGQFDVDLARMDIECKGGLKKDMENLYEAVVEPDGRLRLSSAVHLEKGLKVLVAVPRSEKDSALSGIALSEPSLADDWLNPEEEEAWAHLQ